MPAQRPRASFEPISPNFDLDRVVESTPNFSYVDRINCGMIDTQGLAAFEKLVTLHVIVGGKPLVIDGFEERLDPWTFTPRWLRDNYGEHVENARNLMEQTNLPLTVKHYLNNMGVLTNQFFDKADAYKDKKRQRMYLKDIDCPSVWWDKVREHIPPVLAYLNDSTGDVGGPGAQVDPNSTVPGRRLGKGVARAGDLMSSLPPDMRAENLMCYIGHEGTFTPAHREMCASLGHNIMVEASGTVNEDGQVEKPGSSIWFMTESKDRHLVSEYWLSVLGHDIEVEYHFAQVVAWKKAPFSVYVVDQKPGDLILIPPLAPHQVWNRGTRTMKVAWNRTTVETLEMALHEALPRSRIVCRDEQYKNKAIVYYTLQKYASIFLTVQMQASRMPPQDGHALLYTGKVRQLQKDFRRLFNLFKQILLSEMFNPGDRDSNACEYLPFDSNVTCAYCRGNIFNRFLTCPSCKDVLGHHTEDGEGDPYDVCMDCYAMGRSCACISGLRWVEQFRWKELTGRYEGWRKLIISLDGGQITEKTPLALIEERKRLGKKSLAEICKEQLKRRPFKDVNKEAEPKSDADDDDEEIVVGDDGMVKKVKKKRSKAWEKQHQPCHVCCHRHPTWKMANCTTCDKWWCYGTLFRGWDKMPQEIMEDPDWKCPHCLGICFAGACKKDPKMTPYEPKGTLLGHDTRKVADARSVEALVDFSVSNLNWIKGDDPENRTESGRFKRAEAEARKSREIDHVLDEDDDIDETQIALEGGSPSNGPLDPALATEGLEGDALLAHRLQLANSSFAPTSTVRQGASTDAAPDGYVPLSHAGFGEGDVSSYPAPDGQYSYAYPSLDGSQGVEPYAKQSHPTLKRSLINADNDENYDEDISLQKGPKAKKPRLTAAGFRSSDLAEPLTVSMAGKAKNQAQRQFEREKERKAMDKAKAEGRFIMYNAALRNKSRVVTLRVPADKLSYLLARQAAQAALNMNDAAPAGDQSMDVPQVHDEAEILLRSDIPEKKPKPSSRAIYENKVREGTIITSATKKARVPVEKDGTYGWRDRAREKARSGGAAQKGKRDTQKEYEEVDIGSSEDESADGAVRGNPLTSGPTPAPAQSQHEGIDASAPARSSRPKDRRSLPGYIQNRREEDDDDALPDELPDDFRFRRDTSKQNPSRALPPRDASGAFTSTSSPIMRRPAGKRPSMRPVHLPAYLDNEVDAAGENGVVDDDDDDDMASFINAAARGELMIGSVEQPLVDVPSTSAVVSGAAIATKSGTKPKGRPSKKLGPRSGASIPPTGASAESNTARRTLGTGLSTQEQNRQAKMQNLDLFT